MVRWAWSVDKPVNSAVNTMMLMVVSSGEAPDAGAFPSSFSGHLFAQCPSDFHVQAHFQLLKKGAGHILQQLICLYKRTTTASIVSLSCWTTKAFAHLKVEERVVSPIFANDLNSVTASKNPKMN